MRPVRPVQPEYVSASQGARAHSKGAHSSVQNIIELLKELDIYNPNESRKQNIDRGRAMTKADWERVMSKSRLQRVKEGAAEHGAHPREWWGDQKHPERSHLLHAVIGEKHPDDESEDEKGGKLYRRERCPKYRKLMQEVEQERQKVQAEIQRCREANERLRELGRRTIEPPAEYKPDRRAIHRKVQQFEQEYKQLRYDKREQDVRDAGFGDEGMASQVGGHAPSHPSCWQQLNISINNLAM